MEKGLFDFLCRFVTPHKLARFEETLAARTRFLTVAIEDIYQSHNASACLRSCECFGIQDVHIIENRNEFVANRDVALGATNWLTVWRYNEPAVDNTAACFARLRHSGYRILTTAPAPEHPAIEEIGLDQKTAVVFGTEALGLSNRAFELADGCLRIPTVGMTESLNISVAVAVVLFELTTRAVRPSGWELDEGERQELRETWVAQVLGGRLDPLARRYERDRQAAAEPGSPN